MQIFAAGEKTGDAIDYQGGRDSSDIVTFMMDEALKNMPPPDVLQLNSTDLFEAECTSKQLYVCTAILVALLFPLIDQRRKSLLASTWIYIVVGHER